MKNTNYKILKTEKLPGSMIEIDAEISAEDFAAFWPKAIKHLGEHAKLDGFRPGHIPENVLVSKVGEMAVLEEAAEIALAEAYPLIVTETKIQPITRPEIKITKLAKNNPVAFKIKTAVAPEIKLPDYSKIAKDILKDVENAEVTDKEYEDLVNEIRKSRAPHIHKEGEEHKDDEEVVLPEFNDEFVKTLGEFESVEDFKKKVFVNMKQEKEYRIREKKRIEILNQLVEKTSIELPEILIKSEISKMQSQFEENIAQMKISLDEYFAKINKTKEEVQKEWRPEAEKRAKTQLILNQIALEEKILPTETEIETEVKHLLQHYKDADPARVRMYVEVVITNEKVLRHLEAIK